MQPVPPVSTQGTLPHPAVLDRCDRGEATTTIAYAGLLPAACTAGWGKLCGPCWTPVQTPAARAEECTLTAL